MKDNDKLHRILSYQSRIRRQSNILEFLTAGIAVFLIISMFVNYFILDLNSEKAYTVLIPMEKDSVKKASSEESGNQLNIINNGTNNMTINNNYTTIVYKKGE